MLGLNLFRRNAEIIRESQRRRFANVEIVDKIIQLYEQWRSHQFELEQFRKDFNKINKEVAKLRMAGEDAGSLIKDTEENKQLTAKKEAQVQEARNVLDLNLDLVGNIVHDSVPVSNDEVRLVFHIHYACLMS